MGKLGLGLKLSKWLVFIQNFVFFAAGLAVIGFGAYIIAGGKVPGVDLVKSIAIAIIIVGAVVLSVSFLGCFGSARENRCLLGSYFIFVLLLVIGVTICGVIAFAGFFKSDDLIEEAWQQADNATKTWIYDEFHCCGFVKPDNSTLCINAKIQDPNITGCRDTLENWVISHLTIAEIVAAVMGIVLLVGLTLSCCLFCAIPSEAKRKKKEKKRLLKQAKNMNEYEYQPATPIQGHYHRH
eukprot:TRINITY_DN1050_c0_g1_i1.p1 TRINITY_DN1050_c0_g1~~TRINITY_DN1050_c0_g1_i1.p1  ORF type:complete len:239 (+),score=57.32 TRINITY_DN1050_c0_g1_i1:89-805(+)